jgi:glutamate formiminotransferase/formiminotetrahydrofolate cyclodeaminase
MEAGLKKAVEVPLAVLRLGDGCWDALVEMARHGSIASRSDLEVGAKALEAGLWGAYRNVVINLPDIADEAFRATAGGEAEAIAQRARQRFEDVLTILEAR